MKRKQSTEEQIITILKEAEAGAKVGDLIRRHGIAEGTYYRWKAKYGGMDVSDAKRLKQMEEENRRLKRLVAETAVGFTNGGRWTSCQMKSQADAGFSSSR